jgi:hypothetical protein
VTGRMAYPQSTEYQEAVQHPPTAFFDTELQNSKVDETPLGLPLALSGGFALTYPMTTPRRRVAVRCFHRQVPSAEQRYDAIARELKELNSSYFVNFDYWAKGIKVRGSCDHFWTFTTSVHLKKESDTRQSPTSNCYVRPVTELSMRF